jgi:hypothetical protein
MLLVLSRALVFLLLIVDWVEDPYFGNYLFSRPMASSDVSPLDLGFRQDKGLATAEKSLSPGLPVAEPGLLPYFLLPTMVLEGKPARFDRSPNPCYAFMSLQI